MGFCLFAGCAVICASNWLYLRRCVGEQCTKLFCVYGAALPQPNFIGSFIVITTYARREHVVYSTTDDVEVTMQGILIQQLLRDMMLLLWEEFILYYLSLTFMNSTRKLVIDLTYATMQFI